MYLWQKKKLKNCHAVPNWIENVAVTWKHPACPVLNTTLKQLFLFSDYDRLGHRVLSGRRWERRPGSHAVGVQLTAGIAYGLDGRAANAVGRGTEHRQFGEDVYRQPKAVGQRWRAPGGRDRTWRWRWRRWRREQNAKERVVPV